MDILESYLTQHEKYNNKELIDILDTKINITKNHIRNIKFTLMNNSIQIIKLFEKYGYIFTEDDYEYIISKDSFVLQYISNNNKTDAIYKIAVQKYGLNLQFIPDDKKTDEICELAVRQNGFAFDVSQKTKNQKNYVKSHFINMQKL